MNTIVFELFHSVITLNYKFNGFLEVVYTVAWLGTFTIMSVVTLFCFV